MKRRASLVVLLLCVPLFAAADVTIRPDLVGNIRSTFNAADFNGDGLDDLLSMLPNGQYGIQLNLGGHFAAPTNIAEVVFGGEAPTGEVSLRAIANFNGDAYADLLVTSNLFSDRVFLGNGSGQFTIRTAVKDKQYGWAAEAVDFTGDGFADLLYWKPGQISLLRGNGDGSFALLQTFPWVDSYALYTPPPAADLNGDGRRDFILRNRTSLLFYLQQADGTFAMHERYVHYNPTHVELGDLNGDGHLDIGLLSLSADHLAVYALFGDGTGRFPGYSHVQITDASWLRSSEDVWVHKISIGDFVEGGAQELAYGASDGHVAILSGVGNQLREVAHTKLDGLWVDVNAMRFRSAERELVAEGRVHHEYTVWVMNTDGELAPPTRGRGRAIRRLSAAGGPAYSLEAQSKCPIPGFDSLTIEFEGLFAHVGKSGAVEGGRAANLPGELYVELQVKDVAATRVLTGALVPTSEGLFGKLFELKPSPCGRLWELHKVTAIPMR